MEPCKTCQKLIIKIKELQNTIKQLKGKQEEDWESMYER